MSDLPRIQIEIQDFINELKFIQDEISKRGVNLDELDYNQNPDIDSLVGKYVGFVASSLKFHDMNLDATFEEGGVKLSRNVDIVLFLRKFMLRKAALLSTQWYKIAESSPGAQKHYIITAVTSKIEPLINDSLSDTSTLPRFIPPCFSSPLVTEELPKAAQPATISKMNNRTLGLFAAKDAKAQESAKREAILKEKSPVGGFFANRPTFKQKMTDQQSVPTPLAESPTLFSEQLPASNEGSPNNLSPPAAQAAPRSSMFPPKREASQAAASSLLSRLGSVPTRSRLPPSMPVPSGHNIALPSDMPSLQEVDEEEEEASEEDQSDSSEQDSSSDEDGEENSAGLRSKDLAVAVAPHKESLLQPRAPQSTMTADRRNSLKLNLSIMRQGLTGDHRPLTSRLLFENVGLKKEDVVPEEELEELPVTGRVNSTVQTFDLRRSQKLGNLTKSENSSPLAGDEAPLRPVSTASSSSSSSLHSSNSSESQGSSDESDGGIVFELPEGYVPPLIGREQEELLNADDEFLFDADDFHRHSREDSSMISSARPSAQFSPDHSRVASMRQHNSPPKQLPAPDLNISPSPYRTCPLPENLSLHPLYPSALASLAAMGMMDPTEDEVKNVLVALQFTAPPEAIRGLAHISGPASGEPVPFAGREPATPRKVSEEEEGRDAALRTAERVRPSRSLSPAQEDEKEEELELLEDVEPLPDAPSEPLPETPAEEEPEKDIISPTTALPLLSSKATLEADLLLATAKLRDVSLNDAGYDLPTGGGTAAPGDATTRRVFLDQNVVKSKIVFSAASSHLNNLSSVSRPLSPHLYHHDTPLATPLQHACSPRLTVTQHELPMLPSEASIAPSEASSLPVVFVDQTLVWKGWRPIATSTGRLFYHHQDDKKSVWTQPADLDDFLGKWESAPVRLTPLQVSQLDGRPVITKEGQVVLWRNRKADVCVVRDPTNHVDLHSAAFDNDTHFIHVYLNGASGDVHVKKSDKHDQTAVHFAARGFGIAALLSLVAAGADPSARDTLGRSPAFFGLAMTRVLAALIKVGTNIPTSKIDSSVGGPGLLHVAVHLAAHQIISNALAKSEQGGARASLHGSLGFPLEWDPCFLRGEEISAKTLNLLVKHGADLSLRDTNGRSAEDLAKSYLDYFKKMSGLPEGVSDAFRVAVLDTLTVAGMESEASKVSKFSLFRKKPLMSSHECISVAMTERGVSGGEHSHANSLAVSQAVAQPSPAESVAASQASTARGRQRTGGMFTSLWEKKSQRKTD